MINGDWWLEYCLACLHTGSRVICYPSVRSTDDDYLLLVDVDVLSKFHDELTNRGFRLGGSGGNRLEQLKEFPSYEDMVAERYCFRSYKLDDVNLLVTLSDEWFQNWYKATKLSRSLNLTNKPDRIAVFEAIARDRWPPGDDLLLKDFI